jgi:ribose/xylose/arabinose/galactoside ABC-type transport system permease subunit
MTAAESAQRTTGYADISTGSVAHWLAVSFTLFITDQVDMLYGRKIQAVQETARWIESFTVSWQHSILHVCAVAAATGISTGSSSCS